MNNVVAHRAGGNVVSHTAKQIELIRRTYAADCDPTEFDLFCEVARRSGLDPLRKQIYAVVYNKDDKEKRRMSLITGIDGYRSIASRCGDYRPDDAPPVFVTDENAKSDTNPAGLISATVRAYKLGPDKAWYPVAGTVYWDEFAPLKPIWKDGKPSGEFRLDRGSKWYTMPRIMLAKCAEVQALRRGWPDASCGIYAEEEMERASVIDMTASEIVQQAESERRTAMIGGDNSILIQWQPDQPIEPVPIGKFADMALDFVDKCTEVHILEGWRDTNRNGLKMFWAKAESDARALRSAIDARLLQLRSMNAIPPTLKRVVEGED